MRRFGWKTAVIALLSFLPAACGSNASTQHESAKPDTNAEQVQASAGKPAQSGDCIVSPVAEAESIALDDIRWQRFDFWVDRMRRGVARPADAGDRSDIGHFCGSWLVTVRQPDADSRSGTIGLTVMPDGSYFALVRDGLADDGYEFHIDRGQLAASERGLRFVSDQGWNDEGQWLPVKGGGMVAMMLQRILLFQPIGPIAGRQVRTVADSVATTGKDMASNVALALAVAHTWSPDAELRALEARPHDGDFTNPVIVPSFYSPQKNVTMVMLFDPAKGQLPSGRTYPGDATGTAHAIPAAATGLPAVAGGGRDDGPAVLRWWGDGDAARLWWVFGRPMTASGRGDICYDVKQGTTRDCRALFGDDVADYERRAAQVRRARARPPAPSPLQEGEANGWFLPPCARGGFAPGDQCWDGGPKTVVQ